MPTSDGATPRRSWGAALARCAIRAYQLCISPLLGRHCRFHPTCSRYALDAIGRHGARRGGVLALKRIARCHPFHPGGFDPVPERLQSTPQSPTTEPGTHAAH